MPEKLIHNKCGDEMYQMYSRDPELDDKDENYEIVENGYYYQTCKKLILVSNDKQYNVDDVQKDDDWIYYSQPPKPKKQD